MGWLRVLIGGIVGGIAVSIANFVMHGFILGSTYMKYPEVFTQEEANPGAFFGVAIVVGIFAAMLFAKTRASWAPGIVGGVNFGFMVGMTYFFVNHYFPMVLEGFPYYLAWCWAGVDLIGFVIYGAVLAFFIKGGSGTTAA
jgi:hypothetical protein